MYEKTCKILHFIYIPLIKDVLMKELSWRQKSTAVHFILIYCENTIFFAQKLAMKKNTVPRGKFQAAKTIK